MQRSGHVNAVFSIDTDRIELAPASSHSDLNSTGSQNTLTDSQTNFKYMITENVPDETAINYRSGSQKRRPCRRWSYNLQKFMYKKKRPTEDLVLPSRKVLAVEGRLLDASELEIDDFVNEIEQNDDLMQDSTIGETLRIETIRALPHSLTTKRQIKERLAISVSRNSRRRSTGYFMLLGYKIRCLWSYFIRNLRNVLHSIELWYDSLKEIEGHFGSSVSAYFQFLRWLFSLNVFVFIFTFTFIVFPQILYDKFQSDSVVEEIINDEESRPFRFLDLLTGEGYLKKSILFYGAYTNSSINLGTVHDYNLPKAYFTIMLCSYMIIFIIVSFSMARSYRTSFIQTFGGVRNLMAHKIFCSWDYGISHIKAAELKHANIFNELKEALNEIHEPKQKLSRIWRFWIFCSQFTAHLLIFAVLSGLGIGMWILLQYFGEENESSPWATLYLAIALNITILILQGFFSWIAGMEDYRSPRRALHVTLLRNFVLEAVVVGVLILFWLNKNYEGCWETSIGQEVYRLIIVDFIISVLASSLIQTMIVFILKKIFTTIEKPEFDISRKSLGLVFNQTLLWVGLLFSPLLAAVVVIKMICTFYIKKLTLLYVCKPPTRLWRSAQTQTLYLVITFLSLLGVLVVHGYIMTQVPISQKCGPFRDKNYMFQIFVESVLDLREHHLIWRIVMAFTRPAVMGGILLTMAVIVYYLRSKSHARIAMVKLLKEMLYLEAKDKEFLLLNIARFTQGKEWLLDDYHPECQRLRGKDNYAESCSTWKYQEGQGDSSQCTSETIVRNRHV